MNNFLSKLDPRHLWHNPVLFVTYIGAICILFCANNSFEWLLVVGIWATLLAANFAEYVSERRAFNHLATLPKLQENVSVLKQNGERVLSASLKVGDRIICKTGDLIPADGEVISGIASVDESAIMGESAPVIRESGGDRSAVTEGTRVVSDQITILITKEPGKSLLDNLRILFSESKKTGSEILLHLILAGFCLLFLLTVVSLKFFSDYSAVYVTPALLIALLISLIPTSISGLLRAIRIAGLDRVFRLNIVAKSMRAIESAADVDLLILDKTGTVTLGNREASQFFPAPGVVPQEFAQIAQLASLSDETPEGRSIVVLAKNLFDLRGEQLDAKRTRFIPFSPETRMSGVDLTDKEGNVVQVLRKGAEDTIRGHVENLGGSFPQAVKAVVEDIARRGATPLVVSDNKRIVGAISLKDVIKGGVHERFAELRKMGMRTLLVTGDNPLTAAVIAAEAGIDDFMAEATPEMKLDRIRSEQKAGHLVAMAGDGTSDAPALAQANVGVAMNTGTQASREAGNMIDLDSNPTKLIEIIKVGKELLMTRGCLTLFSLSSDIAKYFAFLPALFAETPLRALNVLQLHSKESAILSTVIFNVLMLLSLIPLAIKGVRARPQSPTALLGTHLLLYGVGGLIVPFVGIKAIDIVVGVFL